MLIDLYLNIVLFRGGYILCHCEGYKSRHSPLLYTRAFLLYLYYLRLDHLDLDPDQDLGLDQDLDQDQDNGLPEVRPVGRCIVDNETGNAACGSGSKECLIERRYDTFSRRYGEHQQKCPEQNERSKSQKNCLESR